MEARRLRRGPQIPAGAEVRLQQGQIVRVDQRPDDGFDERVERTAIRAEQRRVRLEFRRLDHVPRPFQGLHDRQQVCSRTVCAPHVREHGHLPA